jgi:hypothetical protein
MSNIFSTIARVGTAIVTGGTSELIRLAGGGSIAEQVQQGLFPTTPQQILQTASLIAPFTPAKAIVPLTLGISSQIVSEQLAKGATWNDQFRTWIPAGFQIIKGSLFPIPKPPIQGAQPMALNIGGILGTIGNIFGGAQNPIFEGISGAANIASQFFPTPTSNLPAISQPMMQPTRVAAAMPMIRGMGTMLTKEVFDAGSKLLARLGIPYGASTGSFTSALKRALGSVASLARRTPAGTLPNLLIGLGLGSLEAYLLTAWQAQRKRGRRMNPANAKALRRAARRIRSFHKLCTHTDLIRTHSRSRSSVRCGKCRKSPCRC